MDNNNPENNMRKRRMISRQPPRPTNHPSTEETDTDFLTLGLFTFPTTVRPPPPPPPPTRRSNQPLRRPVRATVRPRRKPRSAEKPATIPPPYPWATNRRANIHSLDYLLSMQISTISGEVYCKRCERRYDVDLDLVSRFQEVRAFVAANKVAMRQRAPEVWMNPNLPRCRFCNQANSIKPVISDKKKSINWLFLLLAQMLGCCTLDQLKYLCKHTNNHRTGAKNRVLYLSYMSVCKQLQPIQLFNI